MWCVVCPHPSFACLLACSSFQEGPRISIRLLYSFCLALSAVFDVHLLPKLIIKIVAIWPKKSCGILFGGELIDNLRSWCTFLKGVNPKVFAANTAPQRTAGSWKLDHVLPGFTPPSQPSLDSNEAILERAEMNVAQISVRFKSALYFRHSPPFLGFHPTHEGRKTYSMELAVQRHIYAHGTKQYEIGQ